MSGIEKNLSDKQLDSNRAKWLDVLGRVTVDDVRKALAQEPGGYSIERMLTFISPAAQECLEEMALQAGEKTTAMFSIVMSMIAIAIIIFVKTL